NAALRGRIARHEAATKEAQHRGDVDDAASVGAHFLQGRLADAHRSVEIDVDDLVEDLWITLLAAPDDACTVDDHVNLVEAGDEGPDRGVGADVKDPVLDQAAWIALTGGFAFGFSRSRRVDLCARVTKAIGDGAADATRSTGDEDRAPRKPAPCPVCRT